MSRTTLVLGVDGGGTKSIGLVSDQAGNILARQETGGSNPNVVGFDGCADTLFALITAVCDDAGCKPENLRSMVLGLAGAGEVETRERIIEALGACFEDARAKVPPSVVVETDSRIALEGAFGGAPGVVVVSGTGSVVVGKNDHGDVKSVGGWGRFLGDEGSGYAIGREGVRAVMLEMEGRGQATRLRQLVANRYKWSGRDDIIRAVYQDSLDLSTLAPLVMEAAVNHDLVCQKILQEAASHLVDQVRAVVMKMGIIRKVGLVMCGGLLERNTVFANVVHLKVLKVLPQVDIRRPLFSAAEGAVRMALNQIRRT